MDPIPSSVSNAPVVSNATSQNRETGSTYFRRTIMTRKLSAIAATALFAFAGASLAADRVPQPFSVNDTGPVLTAAQQEYQAKLAGESNEGVAGRPGLPMDGAKDASGSGFWEVQTPSKGGPIDD
jgi:hypothetical protein